MQRAFDSILAGLLGELVSRRPGLSLHTPSVLLAVSGGIDSMCMAELFKASGAGAVFAVAHCNFSLRGEESDSDEKLVAEWAESNNVKIYRKRFDTLGYAALHGLSTEMAARELRYGWFSSLCEENGYDAVAVAHNANDNVETLFLNLLRGTGIKGLSGMKILSVVPEPASVPESGRIPLLRPLLGFTRKQIEGYVFAHKVKYRDDRTNFETEYRRNKIRNLVFPVLEQINPSFVRTINREMSYFSQIGRIADSYYESHERFLKGRRVIDIGILKDDPNWEYLLYRALDGYGFSSPVIYSIVDLLKSGRTVSGKIFNAQKYSAVTAGGKLLIEDRADSEGTEGTDALSGLRRKGTLPPSFAYPFRSCGETMTVHGPGSYCFNGVRFSVEVSERDSLATLKAPSGTLYFDSGKLPFPFLCRRWEKGDWMIPLGMKGRKKVSDLFTDLKYSLKDKSQSVIIVGGDCLSESGSGQGKRVSAVLGVRADDMTKVSETTETVIIVRIRQ